MKTRLLLSVLAIAISVAPQDKGKYTGFTQSSTEHMINELEQPFEVRSVRGAITRNGGVREPLRDVLVEIKIPGDYYKIRQTKTDENGQFKINHIAPGTYRFKVTFDGFQSVVGTIVVSRKAARDTDIKIAMNLGV